MFYLCGLHSARENGDDDVQGIKKSLFPPVKELGCLACAALSAFTLTLASPVIAANQVPATLCFLSPLTNCLRTVSTFQELNDVVRFGFIMGFQLKTNW